MVIFYKVPLTILCNELFLHYMITIIVVICACLCFTINRLLQAKQVTVNELLYIVSIIHLTPIFKVDDYIRNQLIVPLT